MSEDDALEVDDVFFSSLAPKHSLLESIQAKALAEDGDLEGEASEAIRSHHSFENFHPDDLSKPSDSEPRMQELSSLELDEEFFDHDLEQSESRSAKKSKLDSSGLLNQSANQLATRPPTHSSDSPSVISPNQNSQVFQVLLDDFEVDDAFNLSPPPNESFAVKGVNECHQKSFELVKNGDSDRMVLDLEVDENLTTPIESIPPKSIRPNQACRTGEPSLESPISFDAVINEAENYEEPNLVEMDSQLMDDSDRRPTSAQHSVALPPTGFQAPISEGRTLTANNPVRSFWIPTTSIVATKLDGTKIRIQRRRKIGSTHSSRSKPTEELQKQCLELLDERIHVMLAKVRQEIVHKKSLTSISNPQTFPKVKKQDTSTPSLWTDRYRPTKFIDLIGDERVFRSAMSWLKTWDKCVFKKVESSKRKWIQQSSNNNPSTNLLTEAETDPYGRPKDKVLLLAGKPGLGKTTMAEVLAHQAGYQVIEINASDDRSSKTVTDHIKSSLECRTLDGGAKTGGGLSLKDNRPTCVVIDEIDGAAGGSGSGGGNDIGFVKALVKLITEGSATTVTKTSGKGKKQDQRPLVRPIICICNDLYAPVLRPLRPLSRIIRFTNPTPSAIVKRLQTICKSEKLIADLKNLSYLVKIASGDLRSCLNTLQFISSQSKVLNDKMIKSAVEAAVKDSGSSIQTVLSHLFRIPSKNTTGKSNRSSPKDVYLSDLVRDINTCGQNDRIVQGCFESYLSMKPPTDLWRTYERLYDWLDYYDQLETKIWTDQAYQLSSYVPYSIAIWRELMGNVTNKSPEYPRVEYENYTRRSVNEECLSTFNQNLPATVKSCFKTREIVCELLPFLFRIISVDLRPVNSKLVKKEERAILMRVVSIMVELGLKFVQDKGEDGQVTYTLEPAIDFSVYYEGKRPSDIPPPRYAVRQMLLNEMKSFSIRRQNEDAAARNTASTLGMAASIISAYKRKPHHDSKSQPEKIALDFFGRKRVEPVEKTTLSDQKTVDKGKVIILYRYHEGFSNAVKKGIKFDELMLK